MSAFGLGPVVDTIGPTTFAVFTWGSVLCVVVAFGYIVRALLEGRSNTEEPS